MDRTKLKEESEISTASLAKLGINANITMDVLVKICNALDCNFSDIMEMVPVEEKNELMFVIAPLKAHIFDPDIWTMEGFVYLASIMDLYSRKIISWTLGETLETKWVLEAVEKAKRERCVEQPLVIHSDRGVQYTCGDYVNFDDAKEELHRVANS